MKLLIQEDRSISACFDRIENLKRANSNKELAYALNGYTLVPVKKQVVIDESWKWKNDPDQAWEAYQANAN